MLKLRWILVKDIRDYLIAEEVRVSMKASAIMLDHKLKLDTNRERHRRQFELNVQAHMPRIPHRETQSIPASTPVATIMPTPKLEAPPVPVILGRLPAPIKDPRARQKDSFNEDIINPFQPSVTYPTANPIASERKTISQILEFLTNDQYFKFVVMLDRHTREPPYIFIENIGQALRYCSLSFNNYLKCFEF